MFKGISTFTRFFISAALVIIILALCLTFALWYVIQNSFIQHEKASTAQDTLAEAKNLKPEDFDYEKNPQNVTEVFQKFHDAMVDSEIVRIKVWDTKGKVIYSDDPTIIGKTFPDDKEYQKSLTGLVVSSIETRSKAENIYQEIYRQALEVYVPITFNGSGKIVGVIEAYSKLDELNSIIYQILIVQVMSTTAFILAAFILFYTLFRLFIYKPLDKLIGATKSFETGNLSARVEIKSDDEIGKLGFAFNDMADRLQEYYRHLEDKVRERTEELENAKTHYQALFDSSPVGIGVADFNGNLLSHNPVIMNMFGSTEADIKNMHTWDFFEKRSDWEKVIETFKKTGSIKGAYFRLKRKDGHVFDALVAMTKIKAKSGDLVLATIEDISVQKKAERELLKHAGELERTKTAVLNLLSDLKLAKTEIEAAKIKDDAILENIGEGLLVTDMNEKIILVNRLAETMLGFKASELTGRKLEDTLKIEDEKGNRITGENRPYQKVMASCQDEACNISLSDYYIRKNDSRFPAIITAAPIILDHKPIGVVEVFHDITREKEIEREKSEFLSIAAHQLRTPLGSMRWSFEMLLNGDCGDIPKEALAMISTIYESNQSMIGLVNDLLDVSRIEQGRVTNNPKLINIKSVVQTAFDQFKLEAKERKITLNLNVKDGIPEILLDPLHFLQVITNLLSNAIKYNLPQGKVDVSIEKVGDSVKISITNTGKSIPASEQHRLFTKFFRGKDAVRSETSGTGLGLFVVKFYVESWGGKVSVNSPALGDSGGNTFIVSIPVNQKTQING